MSNILTSGYALDPTEARKREKLAHRMPAGFADFQELDYEIARQIAIGRILVQDSETIRNRMFDIKHPDLSLKTFRQYANNIIAELTGTAARVTRGQERKIAISIRAGAAFLPHALKFMPDAEVGFCTQTRDEETSDPTSDSEKLKSFKGKHAIVFDPMLATGGSMEALINDVEEAGATGVTTVSAFTAPQGLVRGSRMPIVREMITTPLEAGLNESAFIVGAHRPNSQLGDMGDRYFG